MRFLTLLLSLSIAFSTALAQGTREDFTRANKFLSWNVRKLVLDADITPHWIGKSPRFWYREPKLGTEEKTFLLADAAHNTLGPAFDHARLAAGLAKVTHHQQTATDLPFESFDFVDNDSSIRFEAEGSTWTCTLSDYECSPAKTPSGPRPAVSPDGRWVAFVRDHNLFVSSTDTGQEIQLTRDGERDYDYATPLPMAGALINHEGTDANSRQPVGVSWSPDSRRLITYRIDSRYSGRFTTVQFAPADQLRPRTFSAAYPLPGEAVARAETIVFDLETGKRVNVETDALDILFVGGPRFTWFKDSKHFYFDYTERGYQRVELREADAITGKVRALISESSKTYVDPATSFVRPVNDGAQFLWGSERDGWSHLYLYDRESGQLRNQVTRGQWVVRNIVYLDDKNRQVYFLGAGREAGEDPYQTHLYRANLDGTGLQLLTPEDATHTVTMSTNGEYFVDNYSRPDQPGKSVLRSAKDG
ncbi:MAG TPA: DPP IV N-terminal domain-containing protein, partial [Terriglobales bacterium]